MALNVHSIESFGTHEGPGIRMVVFLQGCHFRCVYCHNPDTWSTTGGQSITIDEIINQLQKQKAYLRNGGLTVSGGEPLIQRIELKKLFEQAHRDGIHTALDTNGSILDDFTKKLLEVTDLVLLDVKHIDPLHHQKLTGQNNTQVLGFAEYLASLNKPFWLRYVLVPGWTNQVEALHTWARHFEHFKGLQRVEILPYHTLGVYKYKALNLTNPIANVQPPSAEEISIAEDIFRQYFAKVVVR
jgi:pyruvate formate lyase activating enzyme